MDSTSTSQDLFDRLPNDVVLSILQKLRDARSLRLSMAACKRFRSIAPGVVDIYLSLHHKKRAATPRPKTPNLKTLIIKPFHLISKIIKPKNKPDPEDENNLAIYSYQVLNRILKPFRQIRTLHLRLPCNDSDCNDSDSNKTTALLKWKADFGRELNSFVILGARSWSGDERESSARELPRFLPDDELKLRLELMISSLIAASSRHHLVHDTVSALEKVESVVVSDESGQGRLCMNKEEIVEMKGNKGKRRDYIEGCRSAEYRSRVPALRMEMWYLERVETAEKVMEVATLVVIRPAVVGEGRVRGDREIVAGAFGENEEGIDEAVRKLMLAEKCYTMEMNSF